ncbi:MAG TPA: pyridoxamine 5'-phosphate oxidase [Chitinophagaceae bacterium]|jgi:pyridoxamine-phosphate oxidase
MHDKIDHIRKEYAQQTLTEALADANPIKQFDTWWQDAITAALDEPNAMLLATSSSDGFPSARVVLLKEFNEKGFVFFTNYNSFKARQLEENPKACLVFFWKELERQVRITGLVSKVSEEESDAYFNSRPEGSRLGAISSPQSQVIAGRDWLDENYQNICNKLAGKEITRPAFWGGFNVKPVIIEFWQGRPSRLHDRLQYTLQEDGVWKIERLAP